MYNLAKLGFTQSYTYFTWRNDKASMTEYLTELTRTEAHDFFRPNMWPNTPDILHAYLQQGGKPAFKIRLVLAATLAANYGIYGPAFELGQNTPREPGSEEYLNSEKYQIRHWNLEDPDSLRDFIAQVNRIRHENEALQSNASLQFHATDNDQIICYSKQSPDGTNKIIVIVSFDPSFTQAGWAGIDLGALGVNYDVPFQVYDLLSGATYQWQGAWNFIELNPHTRPAHIFRII
jgi:starch synthase (maltosyl-transferring)